VYHQATGGLQVSTNGVERSYLIARRRHELKRMPGDESYVELLPDPERTHVAHHPPRIAPWPLEFSLINHRRGSVHADDITSSVS
jgi:hypothetical protein